MQTHAVPGNSNRVAEHLHLVLHTQTKDIEAQWQQEANIRETDGGQAEGSTLCRSQDRLPTSIAADGALQEQSL